MNTLRDLFPELKTSKGFLVILDPDRRNVWLDPDEQHQDHLEGLIGANDCLTSILIGGSTGVTEDSMDEAILKLIDSGYPKENVGLVPCSHETFSRHAYYAVFPVCINSKQSYFHFECLLRSIETMEDYGIIPIPIAYLLVSPADQTTVGRVLDPDLIEDHKAATKYSKMAEILGFRTLSLEAGSGAYAPAPPDIIKACRDDFSGIITVGGGIKTPEQVKQILSAGADVIIIGDAIENSENPGDLIRKVYDVVSSF